jgi:hypothetical protein
MVNLDGEVVPKPISEWDDKQKKKHSYNAMAMNALFCALNHVEFTWIKNYKMTCKI